ncbi:ATP-binding cassette domain-containing protein [Limnochorda pilosa]|uniref:ATP-binding cassette domain-containing protein n=1 Tax=Limnochorda pilosa TaxID=1555112 RepID=UPI00118737EE
MSKVRPVSYSNFVSNGAGKTTTIQLIVGLLEPTAGRVRVFGLDPARRGLQIRALTGLVIQQTALDVCLTGRGRTWSSRPHCTG